MDEEAPTQRESINVVAIGACVAVGLALLAAAFVVQYQQTGNWAELVPSALLEVGAAVTLVGILFIVERRFVRRVEARTTAAVEQATAGYTEQLGKLSNWVEIMSDPDNSTDLSEWWARERHSTD